MDLPVYLDHHATTPLDPRVLDAMMPYLRGKFGNSSSMDHTFGSEASVAVENARTQVAKAIGARQDEVIFTSGATESNNLALTGTMARYADKGDHLITCQTEHKAVLDVARYLEQTGKKVTYLPVDASGKVDMVELENAITDDTVMISIMAANNEIGIIANLAEIGRISHERDIIFHTDAAQAVGHIPVNVQRMNIDLMSFSAHKMYGPKGVGALYVRGIKPRVKLDPMMRGGGQERNIRSGTLNVPGIVGLARAIEIAQKEMDAERQRFKEWSARMIGKFEEDGGMLNGSADNRLAHNINMRFPGIESKAIINSLSTTVAISAGSACTTDAVEPSHVLLALGLSEDDAHSSIRLGLGRFNKSEEIDYCTKAVTEAVTLMRKIGS